MHTRIACAHAITASRADGAEGKDTSSSIFHSGYNWQNSPTAKTIVRPNLKLRDIRQVQPSPGYSLKPAALHTQTALANQSSNGSNNRDTLPVLIRKPPLIEGGWSTVDHKYERVNCTLKSCTKIA